MQADVGKFHAQHMQTANNKMLYFCPSAKIQQGVHGSGFRLKVSGSLKA